MWATRERAPGTGGPMAPPRRGGGSEQQQRPSVPVILLSWKQDLLDRMRVLTGGASVKTNEALLVNNACVAADLAVALAATA